MSLMARWMAWRRWPARLSLFLLGALAVLGHAPFHIWPLSLVSFSLFFAYLTQNRAANISGFWMSLWFALGYFLAGTYWIGEAFIARGPEFIPVMPPMVFALALLLAFFWGLAGKFYQKWAGPGIWGALSLASLFMLAELVRGHIFGGLPWNLPGYIFKSGSAFSQIASLIGIYGLSTLVLLAAALLGFFLSHPKRLGVLAAPFLGLILLFGYGSWRLGSAEITYQDNVKLRLIQTPFAQRDQTELETSLPIARSFIRLSFSPGLEEVTHLIWPEGAIPGVTLDNQGLMIAMGDMMSTSVETPPIWLLNSLRHEEKPNVSGEIIDHYYNTSAALSFDAIGNVTLEAFNDKYRLVPFGEIIPGGRFVENLGAKTISTALASITPAPQKELADFPGLPVVSPQICYEVVFPGLTPTGEPNGPAEWIFNQSNDAWFGGSIGPHQHANIAAYRAIETGLPIVRSASNGVSGIVDPYGRYVQKLPPNAEGVLDVFLPKPIARPMAFSGLALWTGLMNIALVLIGIGRSRREPQN